MAETNTIIKSIQNSIIDKDKLKAEIDKLLSEFGIKGF